MSWARVDDGMLDHAKWQRIEALGPREWSECLAVWLAVCLYANSALTDGAITWARLDRLTPLGKRARLAAGNLVEAGLMDLEENGVRLHDFLDYNLSASERAEKTAAKTRRQGKWRSSRGAPVDASTPESTGQSTTVSVDSAPPRARSPSPSPSQITDHDQQRSLVTGRADAAAPPTYRDLAGAHPPRTAQPPAAESHAPSPAHRALVAGYRRRMDERGKVWVTIPTAHIEACAAAVHAQSKVTGAAVEDVAEAWLTRAFGDAEMLTRVKADVPPWGVLAKRPEQWLPDGKALDPATAERARLTELVLEGHILTDAERAVMGLPPKGATAERAPLSKVLANVGGRGRIPA